MIGEMEGAARARGASNRRRGALFARRTSRRDGTRASDARRSRHRAYIVVARVVERRGDRVEGAMPSWLFSSRKARREAKRREDDATTTTTTTTGKAETTRSMEDEGENDRDGLVSDFVDALRRDGTLEKLETAARRLAAETRRDVEKCRESSESTLRRRWTDAHPYRAASSSSSERRTRTRMTRMTTRPAVAVVVRRCNGE